MSRRKQAKPRAVFLKHEETDQEMAESLQEQMKEEEQEEENVAEFNEDATVDKKPFLEDFNNLDENSMEASPSNSDTLGTDPSLSWNSETADEELVSLSPSSCATPNSATTEGNDQEVNFTIGPTESTPYACQFCDKAFPRLSYLKKHEQSHSDQMPFKCDFCQRLFKHKRSRDRHVKLHTGDKKYRCPHCESAFSRSDHLKIHMKTHDHQKPYQCVICNRGYNTAAALTSHMQNHKKESITSTPSPGPFRCLQCTGTFHTGEDLQAHVSIHHPPNSSSPSDEGKRHSSSPRTSSPSSRIREAGETAARMMLPFSLPKLACIYCTKDSFPSLESLQLHVQAMHGSLLNGDLSDSSLHLSPIGGTPVTASQCISAAAAAAAAAAISASQSPLTCTLCTMKFSSLSSLHKHAMSVHSLSGYLQAKAKENAFCAQCAIAFPNSMAYAEHFLIFHTGPHLRKPSVQVCSPEPPQVRPTDLSKKKGEPASKRSRRDEGEEKRKHSLLCNQCNAGFSDFESFRAHLKSHLEEVVQKFACDDCESEFGSEEELEAHALGHYLATTTEYGCQSCLKLFCKPDELQKHLIDIHAHHLFRCSLCKEMFDSKVSIQVHFAVKHSNECKLYRCTSCTTIFRSEIEFQVHVKMAHLRKVSPYRCLLCSASFPSELDLQFHLSTHQKQFRCKMCDEAFHVEFLLDKHMQTAHSTALNGSQSKSPPPKMKNDHGRKERKRAANEFKCDICDKYLSSESDLLSHRKAVHHISNSRDGMKGNGPIQTAPGLKSGSSGSSVSLHCAYCSENCKSRSELENHMKSHQIVASGKHKCNICDEVCPTATLLAEHKLTHCKVVSGSVCTGCKQNIISEESYYSHLKQHLSPGNPPVPCVICRQTLITDIEVQIHARFHTKQYDSPGQRNGKAPAQCCVCLRDDDGDKKFYLNGLITGSSSTYLCSNCYSAAHSSPLGKLASIIKEERPERSERQERMEQDRDYRSDPRTYQCIKCQMSFGSEAEVQSHVASHLLTEGSSHECGLCSSSFESPFKLQCHLIEHTFEGCSSFTCYMCSTVFTAAAGLHQHMLEHGLQSKPYDCHLCHLKFFFRAELDNHLVSHEEMKKAILESGITGDLKSKFLSLAGMAGGMTGLNVGGPLGGLGPSGASSLCEEKGRRRKKFFYRSDDSDEELESCSGRSGRRKSETGGSPRRDLEGNGASREGPDDPSSTEDSLGTPDEPNGSQLSPDMLQQK